MDAFISAHSTLRRSRGPMRGCIVTGDSGRDSSNHSRVTRLMPRTGVHRQQGRSIMSEEERANHGVTLEVRRTIAATPEWLFAAWTDPRQLISWWGPEGAACIGAEADLRVGGAYRIGNMLPDGTEIWIAGTFEAIQRPRLLIYSWCVDGIHGDPERVAVRFEASDGATEVIVTHERIANNALRDQHAHGWKG